MTNGDSEFQTSPTLMGRLRADPNDQNAWLEFESRYAGIVRAWCRRWGLQPSDADDLTQDVLLKLSKQMEKFEYDPSQRFRGWLRTIAHRTWCDFLESQKKRAVATGDTGVLQLIEHQHVEDDFSEQFELEWKREILERAMKSARERVQPHTWEAFRLLTFEKVSGEEIARRMDMKVGTVWVAASKVRKMIQQEIARLESLDQSLASRS